MRGKRKVNSKRKIVLGETTFILEEKIVLGLILAIGLFLRIYHLGDFTNFFHDQGRHALVVERIIVDHKLTLLGPQTTAPGVYLGPLYYYLMIIPLWLAKLDPVGMDYMVALIGTLTILMIYLLGKEIFNYKIGLLIALLYATNPLVIAFSNHAWNPNLVPFFMLLTIYGIYKVFGERQDKYWLAIGIGLGCALQLHLFSIVLIPLIMILGILGGLGRLKKGKNLKFLILGFLLLIILLFPWFLFELRHGFMNAKNLVKFFTSEKVGISPGEFFLRIKLIFSWLISLVSGNFRWPALILGISFLILLFKEFKKIETKILIFWLLFGLLILGSYKGVFQYYHGLFLTPLPFLFYGIFINKLWVNRYLRYLGVIFTLLIFMTNLKNFDFKKRESRLPMLKLVAAIITNDIGIKKFNLAGLTWRFDHNAMDYRYFVELKGKKALEPDDYRSAEVLYVINEGQKEDILQSRIMEIRDFQPKSVIKTWEIDRKIKIYKLSKFPN